MRQEGTGKILERKYLRWGRLISETGPVNNCARWERVVSDTETGNI